MNHAAEEHDATGALWALATGYAIPRLLFAVAELGVADQLDGAPRPIGEVAAATGADPAALARILRGLAAAGVFEVEGQSVGHNGLSRFLREDHPRSMRPFVRMIHADWSWRAWGEVLHSARTGATATGKLYPDGGIWAHFAADPDAAALFNQAMSAKAHADIDDVLSAYDFSPFARVVDVGGGRGHFLNALAARTPNIKPILFDLPHVTADAAAGLDTRITRRSGDFFHDQLPEGDLYFLMDILHDWSDADAVRILQAVRRAMAPGARVMVADLVLEDSGVLDPARTLDLLMLVVTGGRERTLEDLAGLFDAAGLRQAGVTRTRTQRCLVEATAA
ncbi:hypothetical protein LJR164_002942 [Phenylobacterium sp. LjRoot164]|uniref:methyltransferase n=1 Tax=unclassified Phenylobacterium TaxID=2640670 RepID=UPI003ECE1718